MSATIALYKTRLDFEADGGSQYVQVDYIGANTINTPYCSQSWVTIQQTQQGTTSDGTKQRQYKITMAPTTAARSTNVRFSCTDADGNTVTEDHLVLYQAASTTNDTGCYINLDDYDYTFPSEGGTYAITAKFGFPASDSGLNCRVSSGSVYPIAWCTATLLGGHIEDDGTEGSEDWRITMNPNTVGVERACEVRFSYTNNYGESTSATFIARQSAPEPSGEEESRVDAFRTVIRVKADGTTESDSSIRVGYNNVVLSNPTITGSWITLGKGVDVTGVSTYEWVIEHPLSFEENNGEERVGTIVFKGTAPDGNVLTSTVTITQEAYSEPETPDIPVAGDEYCGPIWKDIEYNFGGADTVEYGIYTVTKVRLPGNAGMADYDVLIFKGRSCRRPNDLSNTILVNKICQSYMETPLLTKDAVGVGGGYKLFKLKSADGNTTYRTYRFVNDWSYGSFNTGLLSKPILNNHSKVYKNQLLPFTVFGASEKVTIGYGIIYGDGKPSWDNTKYVTNGVETEIFPYTGRTDGASGYYIGNRDYQVVEDCNVQYVLYYVNPWGGYDWFPIRGKVTETDNITQYSYIQNYNNQTWDFGKKRYLSEINKRFTLNTQWLTEDESSRMWYLLQSNTVYLHNLKENKIEPVVITATSQEHKKYSLKSTRISYQIEVELSQTRERI